MKHVWQVEFYGKLVEEDSDQNPEHGDHVVYVVAYTMEDALQAVRDQHDDAAFFQCCRDVSGADSVIFAEYEQ